MGLTNSSVGRSASQGGFEATNLPVIALAGNPNVGKSTVFCTNNTKDVYKDMQENPEVEISVSSPEYAWIRLHGKAVFENNMAAKEMCIQNPIVKGQYGEATNPIFEVFYLDHAHGIIADFSGNPPYEF